jgi:hypothetical protein
MGIRPLSESAASVCIDGADSLREGEIVTTDSAYQALRDAVNLARSQNIRRVAELRSALLQRGHSEQTANEAIQTWANYERAKRC